MILITCLLFILLSILVATIVVLYLPRQSTDTFQSLPISDNDNQYKKYFIDNPSDATCTINVDDVYTLDIPAKSQTVSFILARTIYMNSNTNCSVNFLRKEDKVTPFLFPGPTTPKESIRIMPTPDVFTITWEYGKSHPSATGFTFFNEPLVSPYVPATLVLGYNNVLVKKGTFDIAGSLLVTGSNPSNKYKVIMTMKSGYKGFARGVIPYTQVTNYSQNEIDLNFWDQSAREHPSRTDIGVQKTVRYNMETGIKQSDELIILTVSLLVAATVIPFIGNAIFSATGAPAIVAIIDANALADIPVAQEYIPILETNLSNAPLV